jgi:hypothetical protein
MGVGLGGDRIVDEVEFALLAVDAAIGKLDFDAESPETASRDEPLAKLVHSAHRDRKYHIHRVLAYDCGKRAGRGADDVALRDSGQPDLARDRSVDFGVAQVDLRLLELRLRAEHLRLQASFGCDGGVVGRLLTGWAGKKRFGALQSLFRKLKLRLQLIDRGLLRLNVGFERRLLDTVEQFAFFDLGSFIEEALLQKSRHARDEIDTSHSLYSADKPAGFRQGLFFRPDDAHRRRSARRGLRRRPGGAGEKDEDQKATPRPKHRVTLKIQSALPPRNDSEQT